MPFKKRLVGNSTAGKLCSVQSILNKQFQIPYLSCFMMIINGYGTNSVGLFVPR